MHPGSRDLPAEIDSARRQWHFALNDLNHAGNDWVGPNWKAVSFLNQAIAELDKAEREVAGEQHIAGNG